METIVKNTQMKKLVETAEAIEEFAVKNKMQKPLGKRLRVLAEYSLNGMNRQTDEKIKEKLSINRGNLYNIRHLLKKDGFITKNSLSKKLLKYLDKKVVFVPVTENVTTLEEFFIANPKATATDGTSWYKKETGGFMPTMKAASLRAKLTGSGVLPPLGNKVASKTKTSKAKTNKGYEKDVHGGAKEKIEERKNWLKFIKESKVVGKILSLSSCNPIFEKELLKLNPSFTFDLYENNSEDFVELARNIANGALKNANVSLNYCDILQGLKNKFNGYYSHLILDYCGFWTSYKEDLKEAIDGNRVEVGGIIVMTFNQRGKQNPKGTMRLFVDSATVIGEFTKFLDETIENSTGEYESVLGSKYSNNGSNMFSVILKRTK